MNHVIPFIFVYIHFSAVWQLLEGLKPCDWSLKFSSNIGSITVLITSCTSLSFMVGIPSGLVFPGFPGFGIVICLTPPHWYSPFKTASINSSILHSVIASSFSESDPAVFDPLFFINFLYAANHMDSSFNSPPKSLKVLLRLL